MKIIQEQLKNGLNVFLVPRREATSVAVELKVKAGSLNEEEGKEGLAHFLEHMAFKGTEKWPSALKLAVALDNIGAVYNAYTDKEKTAYWIKTAPEYWDFSLEVLSQMLNHALLKEEEVNKERGVIIEELNMYEDLPMDKVEDLFEEQLLGKNPLGRAIIGKKETILALKRRDFLDFKKRWYCGERMSLAVVGKIENPREVFQEIKALFAQVRRGEEKNPPVTPRPQNKEIHWQVKKTQQTHFEIGFLTVPYADKRRPVASILGTIMGGGMSSRLWREIREKRGWAYYVYSFQRSYSEGGFIAVKAGVKKDRAQEAIDLVKKEFLAIKENLDKEEVARAKRLRRGRFLIKMEDPVNLASLLNDNWLFLGKTKGIDQVLEEIDAVSFSQIRRFAEEFVSPSFFRGAVIGPKD